MNLSSKCTLSAMLLAIALFATESQANAQQIYRGTVNLPFETHWAGAVLQPGPHTISIDLANTGINWIRVTGADGMQTILAGGYDRELQPWHSSLTVVNVNGTYAVRHFHAGSIG